MSLPFNVSTLPDAVSAWEEKERVGLLARETTEWRELRLKAEDPNTTADILDQLAEAALIATQGNDASADLLAAAIVAHPNVRPQRVIQLLGIKASWYRWAGAYRNDWLAYRAFCRNPMLPFLPLEMPGIWHTIPARLCAYLLREQDLPRLAVDAFRLQIDPAVTEAALLHRALVGSLPIGQGGEKAITDFWKATCLTDFDPFDDYCTADWKAQLAKLGVVPFWAAGMDMNLPPRVLPKKRPPRYPIRRRCRYGPPPTSSNELAALALAKYFLPTFARFAATLYSTANREILYRCGQETDWLERFHAALRLLLTDEPFASDAWNRSPLDLLHHLARDGNQWVRWAAQTRLAYPDYVFTWYDGDE